jgi:ClpP class serine protease
MTERIGRRYERRGLLAIEPQAFLELFFMAPEAPVNDERDGATLVTIRGPLEQHAGSWCDSYEAISQRVAAACASQARAIVLRIDSPGGDAQGCFDTAREVRSMCAAAGKPLYAWVEGHGCSAAYALASAAQHIALGDTAVVGSIGVLSTRPDYSAQNLAHGLRMAFIASGSRKTYGHPDAPITEEELADTQGVVDSMAQVFFELVSEHRGLGPDAIAALDAGCFHGQAAIKAGLADSVQPLASFLSTIGKGTAMADDDKKDKKDGGSAFESARAALEEAAKGDDANAVAAKRALAALLANGAPEEEEEPKEDVGAESDDDKETAESETDTDDDKKKKDKEAASAYALAAKAMARTAKLEAKLARAEEATERERLIGGRPDFSAEMRTLCRKAPLEVVRDLVRPETTPLMTTPGRAKPAAGGGIANPLAAAPVPRRGEKQGEAGQSQLSASAKHALDVQMGLATAKPVIRSNDYRLTLGDISSDVDDEQTADESA